MLQHLEGASKEDIKNAEEELGLKFAEDYKEYIEEFGVISFEGHEFTGICNSKRLNVVNVTVSNKKINTNIPSNMYVLEELNYDGFIIWQDTNGLIYETQYDSEPQRIYESLTEYIESI